MDPQRTLGMTPWVRRLVAANLAVFLLQQTVFVDPRFLAAFGFVPLRALAQPWTFLTYMFLHASFLHLAFNLLALFVFGPSVEERMGGGRVGGGVRGDAGVRVGVAGPADLRVLLPRADSGQVARDVRRGCLAGAGAPPRRGRRGASRAPRGLRGRVRVSEDGRLAAAPRRASPAAAERAGRAAARGGGGTTGARGPGGAGRPGGRRPDCRPGEGVRGGAGPGACGDRSRAGQDLRARDRLAHRGRAALPRGDEPPDAGSEVGPARLSRGRPVPKLGAAAPMLVNLVPEFLAVLAAPDPLAAYHDYLDRHRPVLASYWRNYVLDPDAPQAEPVIAAALRADRTDLRRLLEDVDVVAIAEDALRRALDC